MTVKVARLVGGFNSYAALPHRPAARRAGGPSTCKNAVASAVPYSKSGTIFFFKGEEGLRLQLRTDWFDAFNHFNLGAPGSTIGDTRDGGLPVATSGKIFGGSGSRVIQLAMRLIF